MRKRKEEGETARRAVPAHDEEGQAMVPGKIERLCLKARQAIEARDWEKAKQAYLMALGLRSDAPDIHYGLATVYFQLREFTSAAHHFKEVTRLDPLRAGAYINLGSVHNLLQDLDEAIAALRRGIQLDPQRVEGYYNLGLVYRRKGQLELSIQAYREALRLNPRMVDAHLNLANLYVEKQQYRQAIQFYDEALKIRPGWEKALDGRAHAQDMLEGGPEEAAAPAAPGPQARAARGPATDLDRTADPNVHGVLLNSLHQASADAEDFGRQFQAVLADELELAIKELSSCLLYPDGPRSELDACITRFETALEKMRTTRQNIETSVTRLQGLSDHFTAR
jgi:tetratricopeptide (TPR) repeat protein